MSLLAIPSGTSSNAGGFYPFEIDDSLRFNNPDSAYLNRTFTSEGDISSWTLSTWVKLGNPETTLYFMQTDVLNGSGIPFYASDGYSGVRMEINSSGQLRVYAATNGNAPYIGSGTNVRWNATTNAVLRDPSAWYHVVFSIDLDASPYFTIYVNGEQQTFASSSTTDVDVFRPFNRAKRHNIGAYYRTSASNFADCYLAEYHFIDGQALDADDFGETLSGVWVPKEYSGSYGTTGFYLAFAGNVNDSSGNGNNWTANNITSDDYVSDSPTDNFCTLNSVFATSNSASTGGTLSEGNLRITTTGGFFKAGTFAVNSGKWYFEGTAIDLGAQLSISFADLDAIQTGYSYVGYLSLGGLHEIDGTAQDAQGTHPTYTSNDVIGVAIDVDAGKIWWSKNNSWIDSGDPATGANPPTTFTANTTVVPYFMCDNASGTKTWEANFGQLGFTYTPPTGFNALSTANLPDPAIDPAQGSSPEDYFNTVLYTGNGSTQSITGVGFQPDSVWIKARSNGYNHALFDVVRGATKRLYTDSTIAEQTEANSLTSFDTDGFTTSSGNGTNGSGETYVAWNWKANGSGVSNTDGSITSTVSANTESGFSIVSYTGTGSASTVGHGLSSAPDMIIVKNRDAADNWCVYHSALGETQTLRLNANIAAFTRTGSWNDTAPTTSLFTIGTDSEVNTNTEDYIAYCFHSVEGFSKFGSYTGNGSTDGPFVYTGFRPAFVLSKGLFTKDWVMVDNKRNTYNVVNKELFPNQSFAEATNDRLDFVSNGFKVTSSGAQWNNSGSTYIYMAFAADGGPFKYSVAR